MKQFRFWYTGSWTRWFTEDDDLSILRGLPIEKVEVIEEVSRDQFQREFPNLSAQLE